MIEIGKVNVLVVAKETSSGFYLKDVESGQEVFMPPNMAPLKMEIGKQIDAFVYLDTNGNMVATDQTPFAVVGEYALMNVVDVQDFGAFFDWGIEKDLLVPGNEQKEKVKQYNEYLVRVCLEEGTNRIYGTTKIGKYIEAAEFNFVEGDGVKIQPVRKTDLGYTVIINRQFIGMIYANEIFIDVEIGEIYDGVIKKIREDKRVDAALQFDGFRNIVQSKDKILSELIKAGGKLSLCDKSSSEEIKKILGMSKKTFKRAVGMLYKERKVLLVDGSIELKK